MAVHLYVDWTRPDDTLDGSQPTVSGGAGPKKHLNAAKALIPNPVEGEYFIHVAGDTANPDNYVYIDGTDAVIDFSDLNMTHPAARITILPYIAALAPDGFDNAAYNSGTSSPDGGPSWNVAGTKPFTMPPVIADKNNKITLVGARVLQTATNKPAVIVRDMADLAAAYCRFEGGYAGVRVSSANAGIENCFITEAEFGVFVEAGGQVALIGRNILHENSTCGVRGRLRSSLVVCAWPMKPLLKYQTTISTAAPKGSYAAVGLEQDSSLVVLKSIPDETTGGPDIPAAAPTYDPAAIRNSPVLKSAKNDLFTAWTRRNGMDWDRDGNLWRNQPDGWCTAFVAWHFLRAFPNSGFPVGTEGSKRNWFHEHRDQGCYIYPLAVNPATGLNYRYGELGDLICPGYGVSLRSWGHRNIFLYWLESPRFPGVFTSARDVHTAWSRTHIPTDPNQRLPGQFDSRIAINWFRAIGGNQGGARVTVGHYAIVNIEPEFVEIIRDLRQADGPLRTGAVLWCSSILNETEIGNPDGFGFVNLNQKRPVNQGRFGPWNQLGDILP